MSQDRNEFFEEKDDDFDLPSLEEVDPDREISQEESLIQSSEDSDDEYETYDEDDEIENENSESRIDDLPLEDEQDSDNEAFENVSEDKDQEESLFEDFNEDEDDDEEDSDDDFENVDPEEDEDDEFSEGLTNSKKNSKKQNIKNPLKKFNGKNPLKSLGKVSGVLALIAKPFVFIWGLLLKTASFVLGILGKVPLVGKLFQRISGSVIGLAITAAIIPLALIGPVITFLVKSLFGNVDIGIQSIDLPDNGKVTISSTGEFNGDKIEGAEFSNEGEVIADFRPEFKVVTSTINPLTWSNPKEIATCSIEEFQTLEIEETKSIDIPCEVKDDEGFRTTVQGGFSE